MTVKIMSYSTVMSVTMVWERVKAKDRDNKMGELIFQRVIELEPNAKVCACQEGSPEFHKFANAMVDLIEQAVDMLGPESLDLLERNLIKLGKKYSDLGVNQELLPVIETATLDSLERVLGKRFGRADRQAWHVLFYFMLTNMSRGMRSYE